MDQKVSGHHTSTLTTFPQTNTKTSQTQTTPKSRRRKEEEPKKRRRDTEEEEERRRKKKKKKNIYIHNNKYGTGK